MTTTTMITPWITVENAGSTPRNRRSARIRPRMKMPMIGPSRPPRPPARLDAADHDGRHAEEQVRPRNRLSDPGARREREAAERGEEAGESVRDDLRPRHVHAAAERGQLVRADGVQREAEARTAQRDPDQADDDQQDHQRPRDEVDDEPAVDEVVEPLHRSPARRAEHEQRRAGPHEQHRQRDDDVGHAADDHEGAVHQADEDADEQDEQDDRHGELRRVQEQHGGEDVHQRDDRSDRQVDAPGDHDDRLPRGGERHRQRGDGQRLQPVPRPEDQGEDEEADEDHGQADGPGVAAHAAREPVAPAHPLGAQLDDDGRVGRLRHATTSSRGRQPVRRAQQRRLIGAIGRQLVDHAPAEDDDGAVADALDLLQLRGEEQHRGAGGRQLADELVDLALRADVDPARRVVEQERPHAALQPAGDRDLLLVAAREPPRLGLRAGVDLQPARWPRRPVSARPARSPRPSGARGRSPAGRCSPGPIAA